MQIQDQVCSFEQAKRLQELGVTAKSIFYWLDNGNPNDVCIIHNAKGNNLWGKIAHQAYTVAELLNILPISIDNRHKRELELYKTEKGYSALYAEHDPDYYFCMQDSTTAAIVLADLAIHLLENKLISPDTLLK